MLKSDGSGMNKFAFKPNEISQCYQSNQSISILRDAGWCFLFLFKSLKNFL